MVFCASGLATCSSANLIETSSETRVATITDSNEQVETLGATITDYKEQVAQKVWEPDDDERWEVMVLSYFWTNSRPKFKDIITEKEVECNNTICRFSSTIAKL